MRKTIGEIPSDNQGCTWGLTEGVIGGVPDLADAPSAPSFQPSRTAEAGDPSFRGWRDKLHLQTHESLPPQASEVCTQSLLPLSVIPTGYR